MPTNKYLFSDTYLYGPDFSAIRSNYEGLCSVYEAMGNDNKYSKCRNIVEQWNLEQIYPVYIYVSFLIQLQTKNIYMDSFTLYELFPHFSNSLDFPIKRNLI